MSIFRARDLTLQSFNGFRQRVAASGTTALTRTLLGGRLYRISTDTVQSFTTQLTFSDSSGYSVTCALRGGLGFLALPFDVTNIVFSSGTFPITVEIEQIDYNFIAAPTLTNSDVTFYPTSTPTMDLVFTLPAGATGIGIYWSNGTFTDLATTTSPKTAITVQGSPSIGTSVAMKIVAKDANGVWGVPASVSKVYPYQVFTVSGTYNAPTGSTSANVLIVGGGGAGGGTDGAVRGGGGGAGRARYETSVATTSAITVTVGSAGTGVGNANGNAGGQSAFGALTAAGGSGGIRNGAGGASGAGFTGGTTAGGGGAGNTANGGTGPNGSGGAGSTVFSLQFSGGGGGASSGTGSFGGGNGRGDEQMGGTGASRPGSGGGGKGGGLPASYSFPGGDGAAGTVIVEAIF